MACTCININLDGDPNNRLNKLVNTCFQYLDFEYDLMTSELRSFSI